MDGMLSQDEINALLNSMDLSGSGDAPAEPAASEPAAAEPAEEAPAAPANASSFAGEEGYMTGAPASGSDETLTDVEKDAIGEVANISMGSSATTLYSLVNRKVNITTPKVEMATWNSLLDSYEKPCVFIQIKYTVGLDGTNILVLKENDVKIITDLMMGGDGTNTEGELGELHLSAISEAMNQMMGSSATSLSTMLNSVIDISPPESSLLDLTKVKAGEDIAPFLGGTFVKISFRMQIDTLVDSTIMQLYPIEFARKIVDTFIKNQMGDTGSPEPEPEPEPTPAPAPDMSGMDAMNQMGGGIPDMNAMNMGMNGMSNMGMPNMGMPMGTGMNMGMPNMGMPMGTGMNNMANVNVQPAQFQSFSGNAGQMAGQENIGLIMDVPLEVTVELGRTTKSISDILEFTPGTIIELDRIAGEPIDILVNGKFVAKGEVVVIEESFGVRITEIIK